MAETMEEALTQSAKNHELEKTLFHLLLVYWGSGDGSIPPKFIRDAARLCDYPINTFAK